MADLSPDRVKDTTANPAPLGLFGFGMTTVLLNLHNAGLIHLTSVILAMGLCYGGIAQIIAGVDIDPDRLVEVVRGALEKFKPSTA